MKSIASKRLGDSTKVNSGRQMGTCANNHVRSWVACLNWRLPELAMDELAMDELAMDELAMDELAMDELAFA